MSNTREKLIELMTEFYGVDPMYYGVEAQHLADHLIANGVTFAKDNNVGDKWISVKDRLPEKYGRYLALTPSRLRGKEYDEWLIYYLPQSGFYDTDPEWGDIEMDDVTHWMPLPPAPKGE